MVGGHSSQDLCARILVTEYRYEITGIKEENLQDAMPLEEAWEKIQQILHNGGSIITDHPMVGVSNTPDLSFIGSCDPWRTVAHERMTIEELLAISRANYECWCLDSPM
ncbi:hypothetical protein FXO38_02710 [Capsicum annuum]|nr:hypothetical protein FXO38_02710 [Capsicum annuum]